MKAYLEIVELQDDVVTVSTGGSGGAGGFDPACADDGCLTDQDLLL